MPTWVHVLIIALGGGMLLEGALYALFPKGMQRAMRDMQNLPEGMLRFVGLAIAAVGMLIVWVLIPRL